MSVVKTVDYLLLEVSSHISQVKSEIAVIDQRILQSLAKQLGQGNFLTENQANLLVKLLKENLNLVKEVDIDAENVISKACWSQNFRVIEKIRRIFLRDNNENRISIQFTYDKRLKNKLSDLSKKIDGSLTIVGSKEYEILYTEKNIFALINEFVKDGFVIDEKITKFYQEISEILKTGKDHYNVFSLKDEKFKKIVETQVGEINSLNLLKLHDNKFRYGYQISEKITEISLISAIAQRKRPKLFISSAKTNFEELISCLKILDRFPLMIIFDGRDAKTDKHSLEMLENTINTGLVNNKVGIYFRYDKENNGLAFNHAIAQLEYNKWLDSTTSIVGISNNKIPKFMIKNGWKPKSIISLTNNFRNNKSSVYFSDVDLVIFYGLKQPIHGSVDAVM